MFIDSHAHLDDSSFQDDLEAVLKRASDSGVHGILTVGCAGEDRELIPRVLEIVESHSGIWAAFGVHPHDARHFDRDWERRLLEAMQHPKVLGWGEIGLDYYYDFSPRDQQQLAFRRQLRLAREAGKPVIIHSRDALVDTCGILEEEAGAGPLSGVMHCYVYAQETAVRCLDLGLSIAFGGMLTFRKSQALRDVAATIPLDRLLIETDSPYLAPVPFRGKRNEPAHVVRVAETLAEIQGVKVEEVARATTANFHLVFRP